MENNYLIPANSKKSQLKLGLFNDVDLFIFIGGVGLSLCFLTFSDTNELPVLIALASPAMISAFLVAPIPHYHNVRTLIGNIYRFLTGRKKYYWRGWCVSSGNNREK